MTISLGQKGSEKDGKGCPPGITAIRGLHMGGWEPLGSREIGGEQSEGESQPSPQNQSDRKRGGNFQISEVKENNSDISNIGLRGQGI